MRFEAGAITAYSTFFFFEATPCNQPLNMSIIYLIPVIKFCAINSHWLGHSPNQSLVGLTQPNFILEK